MSMIECEHCGYAVSKTYYRVFSDRDGNLTSCPECGRDGMIDGWLRSPGFMHDKMPELAPDED